MCIRDRYKALFELDGVELDFDMGALEAIADKTLEDVYKRQAILLLSAWTTETAF